jgi:pseudouridine-5'-phosphate glycosidase
MNDLLDLADEVAAASREKRAIVALESTIVAHGMPWPQNLETALAAEEAVRALGAVPATIAIVDGRLKAGLSRDELVRFADEGSRVAKASRRDIPLLVARGASGATTVAATMIIAAMAGIRVFATGGIGGVHRGAAASFDISADLQELARTSVAVVCAGAKSILDLGLTLEYLETHGIPVIGYCTDRLPAFFSADSGFGIDVRVMHAKWSLGLHGGIVVANPIPGQFAVPRERIDAAVAQAVAEAGTQRITGKALTPFLLARVNALTGGESLRSNVELVLNNARLGSEVAVAYAAIRQELSNTR